MSNILSDNLRLLGLTENEAEVYLSLMKNAPCFVAPLVSNTKKHRQMVYNALESLLEKHLISSSIQRGKRLFELANPERFMTILQEKELVARDVIERVKSVVDSTKEQVEVYRGLDGFRAAIESLALSAEAVGEYLVLHSLPAEYAAMTAAISTGFVSRLQQVKKRDGDLRVLLFPGSVSAACLPELREQYLGNPFTTRVVTSIPEPPQTVWISGENVYLRNRLSDPLMTRNISSDLSARYREYFELLWDGAEDISVYSPASNF